MVKMNRDSVKSYIHMANPADVLNYETWADDKLLEDDIDPNLLAKGHSALESMFDKQDEEDEFEKNPAKSKTRKSQWKDLDLLQFLSSKPNLTETSHITDSTILTNVNYTEVPSLEVPTIQTTTSDESIATPDISRVRPINEQQFQTPVSRIGR